MFDNNKQPATNKQLWKINHLADQVFNLAIEAEIKEHGKTISDAKDFSISIILPMSKDVASNWIKVLIEKVTGLESLIAVLDQDIKIDDIINGEQNADNV